MLPRRVNTRFVLDNVLGIDINERYTHQPQDLVRTAHQTLSPADLYLEEEPTIRQWLATLVPTSQESIQYVVSLFPSASWLRRYNLRWLIGDVIAGITIGMVVVPQAMAYAFLAGLTPAFGLYTSCTGAMLYWLFGTSKDIVIGATAVGSLLVGQVVKRVDEETHGAYSHEQTAHTLGIMAGTVLLVLGLFRLGWIIEFIPYIPISAFVTAASITIMSTQIPTALGISGVDTRDPPYLVLYNTMKNSSHVQIDAAIGISSLVLLTLIRSFCTKMETRRPAQRRGWALLSSLRLAFAMMLFTFISYMVNRNRSPDHPKFRIVGHIDKGFEHAGVPRPNFTLMKHILPDLPAIAIILVIEHIAIAKSMGRLYGYTVNPSQEIVALGSANMLSPFVGGYVCTGSFGASAVLSKAGVRTPLAGLFSALILIMALYVLTGVFYYIPNAALAGLIIHAVCNLVAKPKSVHRYWQLSPVETLIWILGVILAIFMSLEIAIYTGIILSFLLMLVRLARTKGKFVGRVRSRRLVGGAPGYEPAAPAQEAFLPLDKTDKNNSSNPDIAIDAPYPGVFVYRFGENYSYTNQAYHVENILSHVMKRTRPMTEEVYERESDRLWNDPGPRKFDRSSDGLPYLRAIVFDFAAVNTLDITAVQGLVDVRQALDRYAAPDAVEWHFANVYNRWTRRALAVAGFGYPTALNDRALGHWKPLYSVGAAVTEEEQQDRNGFACQTRGEAPYRDEAHPSEQHGRKSQKEPATSEGVQISRESTAVGSPTTVDKEVDRKNMAAVLSVDRPFFHLDLHEAVESAVIDAKSKDNATTT